MNAPVIRITPNSVNANIANASNPRAALRASYETLEAPVTVGDVRARVARDIALEKAGKLQANSASRLVLQGGCTAKGSVVLLHGFSRTPAQWREIEGELVQLGFNVYTPRLVGHGYENDERLLNSTNHELYDVFAERIYQELAALGGPLFVVGLSGGGAVATRMLQKHTDIERAVLLSPFYQPKGWSSRTMIGVVSFMDRMTFGLTGRLIDWMGFKMAKNHPDEPAIEDLRAGNVFALSMLGSRAMADARNIQTPIQFITTDCDWAIHEDAVKHVFEQSGGGQRHAWRRLEGAPHAMICRYANEDDASRASVRTSICEFLAP